MPTMGGALQPPSALYDPRNADLLALLEGASAFPTKPFAGPEQVRTHYSLTEVSSL